MDDDPLLRSLLDPEALALARETAAGKGIRGRSASALGGFARVMAGLAARACDVGVAALLEEVLYASDIGLAQAVAEEGAPVGSVQRKMGAKRVARLEEMIMTARADFGDGPAWGGELGRYVEEAALMAADDEDEEEEEVGVGGEKVLKLMTVHKAKGLEFDAVFVVGLEIGALLSAFGFRLWGMRKWMCLYE